MNTLNNIEAQFDNLANIRTKLFKVLDVPVPNPNIKSEELQGIEFENPKTQIIYNDKGKYLGTVGDVYQSIQPITFLESIETSVFNCDANLDLSKLTYHERKEGAIISFKLPTEIISFKNKNGILEEIPLFVEIETGFGGTAATTIGLYSKRLICSNGMKIIQSEIDLKFKHTVNMNHKALIFCDELFKTVAKVQDTKEMWKAMDSKQVNVSTTERFIRELAEIKHNEIISDLSTRKQNIFNSIGASVAKEFERTGATVFGLLQGATYYTNHVASGNDAGFDGDFVNVANGFKINTKAQKLALQLLSN